MYQCIYFEYPNKYFLKDDKINEWQEFEYQPTYYYLDPNGEFNTLDGKRVSPTKKYSKDDPFLYEKDIPPTTRALIELYKNEDEPPSFHNILFFDIETEIAGALTADLIKEAPMIITSIALYDVNLQQYFCYILDTSKTITKIEKGNKHIIPCFSEEELLKLFLNKWEELEPTIVSGYNSGFFDIPYLYYRINRVLGNRYALRLSPLQKINIVEWDLEQPVVIGGINHLDYMLLIKKFFAKQEPSYKLGDIGEKYAKLGKIEFEGNLDRLFKEDPEKFIEYNIRDVEILLELDKKLKHIDLTIGICHLCHVPYESIYWSTVLNEGAILTYLKRKNIVSPNKPTTINPSLKGVKQEYAGGYLKEPIPGLYEWVSDLDFTSLYPSIIRNLNMGIETLIGRIQTSGKYDNQWGLKELKSKNPLEVINIEQLDNYRRVQVSKTTIGKLIKLIEDENLIISANGVLFRQDKKSVVVDVLNDWFDKRAEFKKKMKTAKKAGDKDLADFYDKRQYVYKIKLNDLYGCYAINGWRYSDGNKFISSAITLTGQRLDQESINFINKEINTELNTNKDYVVTADTDSLFFELKDLIKHRYPETNLSIRKEAVEAGLKITKEYQDKTQPFLQDLCKNLFNIDNIYFELKQEVLLERGYFADKRRYAQFIVNKEGVDCEELDLKGLDISKSNMNPLYKTFAENLVKDIMYGKSKLEIDNKIIEFRKYLNSLSYNDIAKPTGVKKIKEYVARPPQSGEIFSQIMIRCPEHTRAAINYNDLLRFKEEDKNYPCFTEGDKMKYVKLKENPYKIDVIGFTNKDPQFIIDFIQTYVDLEEGFRSLLLQKLENIYKDLNWQFPSLNSKVNKFFKFV
jgi:DNA polymerase elongation subunit (family B)